MIVVIVFARGFQLQNQSQQSPFIKFFLGTGRYGKIDKLAQLWPNSFTHLAKGGKTATADNPIGTRAKDKDNVGMLASVGSPPPPGVPADTDPPGLTLSWKFKSGIIITMPIILAPKATPTCVAAWIAGDAVIVGEAVKDKLKAGSCKITKIFAN